MQTTPLFKCWFCNNAVRPDLELCPACNHTLIIKSRYQIVNTLGSGGYGVVYRANDQLLSRICAIKKIPVNSLKEKEQIELEVTILSKYTNDLSFVPDIYDIYYDNNSFFIIMEYVEGENLSNFMKKPWEAERSFHFFIIMIDYFEKIHSKGIIHRDIKPENIHYSPDRGYTILDFGISKHNNQTKTIAKSATLEFAPPEQIHGLPTNQTSDLYSLAILVYIITTGQYPFGSLAIRLDQNSQLVPMSYYTKNISYNFDRIIHGMLSYSIKNRPSYKDIRYEIKSNSITNHLNQIQFNNKNTVNPGGKLGLFIKYSKIFLSTIINTFVIIIFDLLFFSLIYREGHYPYSVGGGILSLVIFNIFTSWILSSDNSFKLSLKCTFLTNISTLIILFIIDLILPGRESLIVLGLILGALAQYKLSFLFLKILSKV